MDEQFVSTLPPNVKTVLTEFIEHARSSFGNNLRSVVIYGSGAEGQLRPSSDVNLLLVLSAFDQSQADQIREPFRLAQAAIRLRAMFLLESELQPAIKSFAVKFADIIRRRRVLYGDDPFAGVLVSRSDSIIRLKQTLLNLTLRLREAYIARGMREEQLIATIADLAGPLRSCAATLLELEGKLVESSKDALLQVAVSYPGREERANEILRISEARERGTLAPGVAAPTLIHLIELARHMRERADVLE